jgi:hypothetical protein
MMRSQDPGVRGGGARVRGAGWGTGGGVAAARLDAHPVARVRVLDEAAHAAAAAARGRMARGAVALEVCASTQGTGRRRVDGRWVSGHVHHCRIADGRVLRSADGRGARCHEARAAGAFMHSCATVWAWARTSKLGANRRPSHGDGAPSRGQQAGAVLLLMQLMHAGISAHASCYKLPHARARFEPVCPLSWIPHRSHSNTPLQLLAPGRPPWKQPYI